jgi:hypothetical protein
MDGIFWPCGLASAVHQKSSNLRALRPMMKKHSAFHERGAGFCAMCWLKNPPVNKTRQIHG